MLASIIGWLSQSWFGALINAGLQWWTRRKEAQTSAENAENSAIDSHQSDGAQSVADKTSADAQNAALDKLQQELDNPTPVVVVKPEEKP